jgi:prephenate dehydrogenase
MPDPERIAIVGLGLIGGSLALALRRARPSMRIVGVDEDPRPREQALEEQAVDAATSLAEAPLDVCDTVVLATPAQPLLEMIPAVAARMRPGALLTDVCGAKERICAAGAAQERVVFIGGHPMAGTEYRGFVAANPALFTGCTVALCPAVGATDDRARRDGAARVRALWTAAGADKLLDVEPAVHDRAVTFASHLPYLAAAAVVDALLSAGDVVPLARELAAGGFRDTTRLAGDGTLGGAASLNRFVPQAARALAERLRAMADELESDPSAVLQRLGELADERRRMRMPAVTATSTMPATPPIRQR